MTFFLSFLSIKSLLARKLNDIYIFSDSKHVWFQNTFGNSKLMRLSLEFIRFIMFSHSGDPETESTSLNCHRCLAVEAFREILGSFLDFPSN